VVPTKIAFEKDTLEVNRGGASHVWFECDAKMATCPTTTPT